GATSSTGEWLLLRFTTGVLCGGQGRPPAFPAVGREGWMGTRLCYSVTLRLAQCCMVGMRHGRWCGVGAQRAGRPTPVWWRRGGVAWPARRTYAGTAGGSTGCAASEAGGVAVWSITEALPGAAEYKEMYTLHGAGRSVDERIAGGCTAPNQHIEFLRDFLHHFVVVNNDVKAV
ncbi:hypothetical protein B0H14DRAFT_3750110, partial [Mycena olivaceomarginata]